MYIFKKNMLHLYIKYIYYNEKISKYKYLHVNIFKMYALFGCIYLYIINIHNIHTYIM